MKKFFKTISKKSKENRSAGPSPSLSRGSFSGGGSGDHTGYDVREKDLSKLHKAAWLGDVNKVHQYAKKDPSALDKQSRTPLHLACSQGHHDVVAELLEWKAKTNISDNDGKTPLHKAVEAQHTGCVELLLDYQCTVNTADICGDTPLHVAAQSGNGDIVLKLLEAGAKKDIQNKAKETVLHAATKFNREDIVNTLLDQNANPNLVDNDLQSPLMLACRSGSINIVRSLLAYNADSSLKDSKGWSADDIAVMQAHHSCSQLITDHIVKQNILKKHQSSNVSTPRSGAGSSQADSPPQSRHDEPLSDTSAPLGIPAVNIGDEVESEDEATSRMSVVGGEDSWADDTDISLMEDKKKKKEQEDKVVQDTVIPSLGIDLSSMIKKITAKKQDSNVSQFSAEINWETPVGQSEIKRSEPTLKRQESILSEDDSWSVTASDSPKLQKKTTRVSFKRDDELSEIHDISLQENSDNETVENLPIDEIQSHYTGFSDNPNEPEIILSGHENMNTETNDSGDDINYGVYNPSFNTEQHPIHHGILKNWKMDEPLHINVSLAEQNITANNQPLESTDWDSSEAVDEDGDLSSSNSQFRGDFSISKVAQRSTSIKVDEGDWDSEEDYSINHSGTPTNSSPVREPDIRPADGVVPELHDAEFRASSFSSSLARDSFARRVSYAETSTDFSSSKPFDLPTENGDYISGTEGNVVHKPPPTALSVTDVIGGMKFDSDEDDDESESINDSAIERVKAKMKEDESALAADPHGERSIAGADQQMNLSISSNVYVDEIPAHSPGTTDDIPLDRDYDIDRQRLESERIDEWSRLHDEAMDKLVAEAEIELENEKTMLPIEDDIDTTMTSQRIDPQLQGDEDIISPTTKIVEETPDNFEKELNYIQRTLTANEVVPTNQFSFNSHMTLPHLEDLPFTDPPSAADNHSFLDEDSVLSDLYEVNNINRASMMLAAPYLSELSSDGKICARTIDDDGLSMTSTEDLIGGEFAPSPVLPQFQAALSPSINLEDGRADNSKLMEQLRNHKRQLEREKYQYALLNNKYRCLGKEKADIQKKLDELSNSRSTLEQEKVDLSAKIRSLEYHLTEEKEKRENAELLLKKTKEQLERKEDQYTTEIEDKQKAELILRNNNMEMRSANITIKQLKDQKDELQRLLTHERNARAIQDEISHEQQKTQLKLQSTTRSLDNEKAEMMQQLESTEESRREAEGSLERYKTELYALKLELERLQARRSDEIAMAAAETDTLHNKIEDLKYDVRLNEEALSQATMQYNVQISQLKTDLAMEKSTAEKERANKDKLHTQVESLKNRINITAKELEKSEKSCSELERQIQKEKDGWSRYSDKKEHELKNLHENSQSLQERLSNSESHQIKLENEMHIANDNMAKATDQLNRVKKEYDQKKQQLEDLMANHVVEKEKNTKLTAQNESAKERCSASCTKVASKKRLSIFHI